MSGVDIDPDNHKPESGCETDRRYAVTTADIEQPLTRLRTRDPDKLLGTLGDADAVPAVVSMILSPSEPEEQRSLQGKDPSQLAVFPLAVPYLLNPAGIVVLVTELAEAGSVAHLGIVLALLALVLALDVVVFRWANRVNEHLDESRMLVTEKVFGFLLVALAVELALSGLADVGVIHLNAH